MKMNIKRSLLLKRKGNVDIKIHNPQVTWTAESLASITDFLLDAILEEDGNA